MKKIIRMLFGYKVENGNKPKLVLQSNGRYKLQYDTVKIKKMDNFYNFSHNYLNNLDL